MQAIHSTRPGGHVGFVGVSHDVAIPGDELFMAGVHIHGGPAPVRQYLPGWSSSSGTARSTPARSSTSPSRWTRRRGLPAMDQRTATGAAHPRHPPTRADALDTRVTHVSAIALSTLVASPAPVRRHRDRHRPTPDGASSTGRSPALDDQPHRSTQPDADLREPAGRSHESPSPSVSSASTPSDSAAARDLVAQLPVTVDMTDHGGVEKPGPPPSPLSLDGQPGAQTPTSATSATTPRQRPRPVLRRPGLLSRHRDPGPTRRDRRAAISAMNGSVTATIEASDG